MKIIKFTKSNLPYGWMGNMAGFSNGKELSITYEDKLWKTSENLFQALRFNDVGIQGLIRRENGFNGKKVAKRFKQDMSIRPLFRQDVLNMIKVVRLKLEQHKFLLDELINIEDDVLIIEDVSSRMGGTGLFWGSANVNNQWIGHNCLGYIYMYLRDDYLAQQSRYGDDDNEFIEFFFKNIISIDYIGTAKKKNGITIFNILDVTEYGYYIEDNYKNIVFVDNEEFEEKWFKL